MADVLANNEIKNIFDMGVNTIEINKPIEDKIRDLAPETNFEKNAMGLSELFAALYKYKHLFNVNLGGYMYYDGKRWANDINNIKIRGSAKEFAVKINNYIPASGNPDDYAFTEKKNLTNPQARNSLIKDAEDLLAVEDSAFDNFPYLINCGNCIIDLQKIDVYPHDPKYMLTQLAKVTFIKDAQSDILDNFMLKIFEGDTEVINYVYRVLGYALCGSTIEDCLFMFYGDSSRNGKSTLLNTITYMFGDYATTLDIKALMEQRYKSSSAPSPDIVKIKGKRFILASEPKKGYVFDESKIKAATGGDKIVARGLHQSEIEFEPEGKIFIGTNHLPIIKDNVLPRSKRLRIIPLNHFFKEEEQDKTMQEALRQPEVLSAFLFKCLKGYREYEQNGLQEPPAVIKAMSVLKSNEDVIRDYFDECLIANISAAPITLNYMHDDYEKWCLKNKLYAVPKSEFEKYLVTEKIFYKSGTIDGVTKQNVIKGFAYKTIPTISEQIGSTVQPKKVNEVDNSTINTLVAAQKNAEILGNEIKTEIAKDKLDFSKEIFAQETYASNSNEIDDIGEFQAPDSHLLDKPNKIEPLKFDSINAMLAYTTGDENYMPDTPNAYYLTQPLHKGIISVMPDPLMIANVRNQPEITKYQPALDNDVFISENCELSANEDPETEIYKNGENWEAQVIYNEAWLKFKTIIRHKDRKVLERAVFNYLINNLNSKLNQINTDRKQEIYSIIQNTKEDFQSFRNAVSNEDILRKIDAYISQLDNFIKNMYDGYQYASYKEEVLNINSEFYLEKIA